MDLNVIKGYVIAIGERRDADTNGVCTVYPGRGKVNIKTDFIQNNEFWMRNTETGKDQYVPMGANNIPRMLPGHSIIVITAPPYNQVVAIANHDTGEQMLYKSHKPNGPWKNCRYAEFTAGELASLIISIISGIGLVAFHNLLAANVAGVMFFILYIIASIRAGREITLHNAQLDNRVGELLSVPGIYEKQRTAIGT